MTDVKFGFHFAGDPWEPEELRCVEDCGFDYLTTGEHIVFHRPILESVAALGYAAGCTRTIKLVPSTLILPLRHPTMVAKSFASLDVLSKGRVVMTVGVGGDYPREFHACGVPMNERGQRANEAIEIMRKYWSGERFSYAGKIFQLEDVDLMPLPVQKGGPPIWVSGRSRPAMRRAALLGDGWNPYMYSPDLCRESFFDIKQIAEAAGRTLPGDFAFSCFIYCAMDDDVEKARREGITDLEYRYKQPFDKLIDKYCAYGPPARIAETISQYIEAGANQILIGLTMPEDRRQEYTERFANEVLPELRKITPGVIV